MGQGKDQKKFTVVVALEFSDKGDLALSEAWSLTRERDGVLHVVHVADHREIDSMPGRTWREKPRQAVDEGARRIWDRVERLCRDTEGHGELDVWAHVRLGPAAPPILEVAAQYDADLIVVGQAADQSWLDGLISRSVARKIGRLADCPVLLAKPNRPSSAPPPPGPAVYETAFPDEPAIRAYTAARSLPVGST